MPKEPRTIPVASVVTTALEVAGVVLLTIAAYLAFAVAGMLAVLGVFCFAASYVMTRGGGR